jgi:hypothetical protein
MAAPRWTDDEIEKFHRLVAEGRSYRQASIAIGKGPQAGKKKVWNDARASRANPARKPKSAGHIMPTHAPTFVELRRDAYLSAPPRSLVGALMGDPPVGFSALDKRGA